MEISKRVNFGGLTKLKRKDVVVILNSNIENI